MPMRDETELGGPSRGFPSTRWTVVREAGDRGSPGSRQAMEALCRLYWKPAYVYIRSWRAVSNEEAKDLTQRFLMEMVDGGLLSRFSPGQGSFRSYVRGALRLFLLEEHRGTTALKRGGERSVVSLTDPEQAALEDLLESSAPEPDRLFDRQWAQSILEQALDDVRRECELDGREKAWLAFERYEVRPPAGGAPSYADLARDLSLKETDVSNHLMACRRRLRERLVERVRDTVASEPEAAAEFLRLFS